MNKEKQDLINTTRKIIKLLTQDIEWLEMKNDIHNPNKPPTTIEYRNIVYNLNLGLHWIKQIRKEYNEH